MLFQLAGANVAGEQLVHQVCGNALEARHLLRLADQDAALGRCRKQLRVLRDACALEQGLRQLEIHLEVRRIIRALLLAVLALAADVAEDAEELVGELLQRICHVDELHRRHLLLVSDNRAGHHAVFKRSIAGKLRKLQRRGRDVQAVGIAALRENKFLFVHGINSPPFG